MAVYYVGPGGNDGNNGLTWILRKLTLNGAEDIPVAVGDTVYVGPGVYREQLTCDVSGGSAYTAGTVTVTNGSTIVTGAGTAFLANVAIADMFHVRYFASGNDGVANGTATFTSAAGNFQASMIGKIIQIHGRAPHKIGAVAAANSITLVDVNGVGWPGAGVGLTYSVMSGEGPYEIESITDSTNFELVRPWCGPTLTGLAYIAYTPIRYIADVTGEHTDGVGGVVRVTGSDNDQTRVRNYCVVINADLYRLFRGFKFDLPAIHCVHIQGSHATIEDCTFYGAGSAGVNMWGTIWHLQNTTVRRCVFYLNFHRNIWVNHNAAVDSCNLVIENCLMLGGTCSWRWGFQILYIGGVTIKNTTVLGHYGGIYAANQNGGQTIVVNNCLIEGVAQAALEGSLVAYITEDFNSLFNNATDRVNTAVGVNSVSYPGLIAMPLLHTGFKFPWNCGDLTEWSQIRAIAGAFETCGDLHGIARPITSAKKSWGATQFTDMEHDTGTVYAGVASMELSDAGRVQMKVPITNKRYTTRARVYREANYAGVNPQLVIKQPGQADRITTDVGAAGTWNLLEDPFTPAALPPYLFIELVSNNTAVAGNYAVYFDRLAVRGPSLDSGEFEQWLWDRQSMEDYGKVTPVVKKDIEGHLYAEINAAGDLLKIA